MEVKMEVKKILESMNKSWVEEGAAEIARGSLASTWRGDVQVVEALEEPPRGFEYACPRQMMFMLLHQQWFKKEKWWGERLLFEGIVFRDINADESNVPWYRGVTLWVPSMAFRDGMYSPDRDFRKWSRGEESIKEWKRVCVPRE